MEMAIMMGDSMTNGALEGSVLFVGSGPVLAQDPSNFFWDNANKRLGIGTTTPQNGITVRKASTGAVRVDAINTEPSSGANAFLTVSVAGAGAGDPVVIWDVAGVQNWAAGIDNTDADKFKIASSAFLGTDDRLVITTEGNVGVNELNPTARLHLGAGTASLAPLKLTAGTNLSTPEAGALEFDGADLFITLADGTRRFLTMPMANVRDFGAAAIGSTDDSQSIQNAVDSLVSTGGVVYFPPGFKYFIGSQINIKSQLPIWVVSHMSGAGYGSAPAGAAQMAAKAIIQPKLGLTGSMFCWDFVDGLIEDSFAFGGPGGGVCGIRFVDFDGSTWRNIAFEAAIHVKAAVYFAVRDCHFGGLNASAIKVTQCDVCQILLSKAHQCGNTGKPVLNIGGTLGTALVNGSANVNDTVLGVDTVVLNLPDSDAIPLGLSFYIAGETGSPVHTVTARSGSPTTSITFKPGLASGVANDAVITFYPFAGVYADWLFLEAAFGEYTVKVHSGGALTGDHLYFENVSPYNPILSDNTVFIDADGGVDLCNVTFNANTNTAIVMRAPRSRLRNVNGTTYAGTLPIIKVDAAKCVLSGITIDGSSGTGPAILMTANGFQSSISDVFFYAAGTIDVSAVSFCMLSNVFHLVPNCGAGNYAINLGNGNTLDHAIIDGNTVAPCHGVQAGYNSHIGDVQVHRLAGGDGITTTASGTQVLGCGVYTLDGEKPYVLAAGTISECNLPWADGLVYSNAAASGSISDTTIETDFDKSYLIDAHRLRVGTVIRVRAQAFVTSAVEGTLNLRLKIGNTVIQSTGAVTAGSSFVGYFDALLTVRLAGASGLIIGTTEWGLGTYDVVTPKIGFRGGTMIDTTIPQMLKVSAQWSAANVGNNVRLDVLVVEILNGLTVG
jgi:hypothetical protein